MTTPTREQVVQWSSDAFKNSSDYWNYMTKFATLARADIEATIAEQAAEIARLSSEVSYHRITKSQDLPLTISVINEREELRQQLSAEQAYADQLREALQRLTQFNSSEEYVQVRTEHVSYGRSALSIPSSADALREYGAKLVEPYKKDAERYRWIRSEHERIDPMASVVWKRGYDRKESEWVNTSDVNSLDAAIDAAMKENEQ